ncbi:MAG: hypothetical protein Q8Q50_02755 [Methylobacter sp.]|nr:hypothetical protein [Methylobacter sp.]
MMQLNRCPICHSRISVDALVQDEAGRELLGLLVRLDIESGSALVGYLGLFRSPSRDLANDRALKLAKDALGLGHAGNVAQAMRQTVDSLQGKGGRALTNHNYLKRVLEDYVLVSESDSPCGSGHPAAINPSRGRVAAPTGATSKTAQALQALEDFGNGY